MNGPILRIVRMTFRPEEIVGFIREFDSLQPRVSGVPGCTSVRLERDAHDPTVCATFSVWESVEHLNAYRESALFGEIWPDTKRRFAAAPEVWTYFWPSQPGFFTETRTNS